MSCGIQIAKLADYKRVYNFPDGYDLTGFASTFTIYDSVGGAELLNINAISNPNGSVVVSLGNTITVLLTKEDIADLPENTDPALPALLRYELRTADLDDLETKLEGGQLRVIPAGGRGCDSCTDEMVFCLGGEQVTVFCDGGSLSQANEVLQEAEAAVTEAQGYAQQAQTAANEAVGATAGKADIDLGNVVPYTGRSSLAIGGFRSVDEIASGLTPSQYSDALEDLCEYCAVNELALFVPSTGGNGVTNRTIETSKVFSIFGEGPNSIIRTTGINAPVIRMRNDDYNVTSGRLLIRGVHLYNDLASTANELSAGIEFVGTNYLLYAIIEDVFTTGCYAGIKNSMDTLTSVFGEESYLNHLSVTRLWVNYHPASVNAKYGVWHTNGSGTGGTYRDMKGTPSRIGTATGDIASQPAYVRIDGGSGVVCGDVVFDGHITAPDSAAISIDGAMNYLAAITNADVGQVDALATASIRFDPMPANPVNGIRHRAYTAGEIDIGGNLPLLVGSVIEHQGVGSQKAGVQRNTLPSGALTKDIGYVDMRQYSGGVVRVSASGLVQGVGGGTVFADYGISSTDTLATATLSGAGVSVSPPGFTGITLSVVATGLRLTFRATITGLSPNSDLDGQIDVIGGRCKLTRGVA